MIDKNTLGALFNNHGTALRTLRLFGQADKDSIPAGLQILELRWLTLGSSFDWPSLLVAQSYETVRHLGLGFEIDGVKNLDENDHGQEKIGEQQSKTFGKKLKDSCQNMNAFAHLTSLKLIGFDVNVMLDEKYWPSLNLRNIGNLVLEDCFRVAEAFSLLSSNSEHTHYLPNLTSFTFRRKHVEEDDRSKLQKFLCSLPRGLINLSVLLSEPLDYRRMMNLEPILCVHGKTLRTLIWDERKIPTHRDFPMFIFVSQ